MGTKREPEHRCANARADADGTDLAAHDKPDDRKSELTNSGADSHPDNGRADMVSERKSDSAAECGSHVWPRLRQLREGRQASFHMPVVRTGLQVLYSTSHSKPKYGSANRQSDDASQSSAHKSYKQPDDRSDGESHVWSRL